ncbi:MAG: major capsid protein [Planctomycetota bacterium]
MADNLPTVADLIADALDLSGTEIGLAVSSAPLVSRLPFVESSDGIFHRYIAQVADPKVAFVGETDGRDFSHSIDVEVAARCQILDFSFAVRKSTADTWRQRGGARAYLNREGLRHIASAMRTLESQILNNTDTANGFAGLPTHASLDGVNDEMVVDAGGTTANTGSSVYLMRLGDEDGVCGVFRGGVKPFELGEPVVQNMATADGRSAPHFHRAGTGWFGLQLGGAFTTSRIANITEDAGATLTDDLIFEAINKHPADQQPNVIVMSARSREQLRASRTAVNDTGEPAPRPSEVSGVPLIVVESMRDDEQLLHPPGT